VKKQNRAKKKEAVTEGQATSEQRRLVQLSLAAAAAERRLQKKVKTTFLQPSNHQ
jgi:hypothetical protein